MSNNLNDLKNEAEKVIKKLRAPVPEKVMRSHDPLGSRC